MNQPAHPQYPPGPWPGPHAPQQPMPGHGFHPQMMWPVPPKPASNTASRAFLVALFLAPIVLITAWGVFIEFRLAAIERLDHGRVMEMQSQLQDVSSKLQKVTDALLQIINLPENQKPPETEQPRPPAAQPEDRPTAPSAPANRPTMQPESSNRPTRQN